MRIDLYTKTVLTVIAGCLVWMCVSVSTPVAQAQAQPAPLQPSPVVLVDVNGTPLRALPVFVSNDSVPVAVNNQALAVTLRGIQRGATARA